MEPTTFGLNVDQVKRLLKIGADPKGSSDGRANSKDRGALLGQWLEHRPPEEVIEVLVEYSRGLIDRPVRSLLLSPDTSLPVFERLKALYKERLAVAETRVERDAATALYYAVIACGLLCHRKKLSSYSYQELARAFASLARKKWLDGDLRELFAQAGLICRTNHNQPDGCDHE